MLSALKNNLENSDLKAKIMKALEPVITEHWSTIAPYADQALAAAQDDATIEKLARKIYPWLPAMLRLALKEDSFVAFTLEHKTPLLNKLAEIKAKQTI